MTEKTRFLVETARMADIVGRDPSTVRRWAREGCPHMKRGADLVFRPAEVIDWLIERHQQSHAGSAERARLLRAQADKTEEQVRRMRADLLPVVKVADAWEAMVSEFRRIVKARVTGWARPLLRADRTMASHNALLTTGAYALLTELSNLDPETVHEQAQDA